MLARFGWLYAATWIVSGLLALVAEQWRLRRLRPLPLWADAAGAFALAWFAAPAALLLAPFALLRRRPRD